MAGNNAEVGPGQHEFQVVGEGLTAGDDLMMARYLLERIAAESNMTVSFAPKPKSGPEWNGSGLHTNFSTIQMRSPGGYDEILRAIGNMEKHHKEDIVAYGPGNEARMTGECETACFDTFTWGVADRSASVRIGRDTQIAKCGYLEDRRPPANANPYVIMATLVRHANTP